MKRISIGSWITIGHHSVAEIMAESGFDWLCIDMEHSVIDYNTAQILIMAIKAKNIKAYIRVAENNPVLINKALDSGADGIIVPKIMNIGDANKAISNILYPPKGTRGAGLHRAQDYGFTFERYARGINKDVEIFFIIEHVEAINNLNDILSVKKLTGTLIGPYDLSGSMGKPGDYDASDVQEVIKTYEEISNKFGKMMGFHVIQPDYELVINKIKAGYTFIAFSLDTLFLGTIYREQMKLLKEAMK